MSCVEINKNNKTDLLSEEIPRSEVINLSSERGKRGKKKEREQKQGTGDCCSHVFFCCCHLFFFFFFFYFFALKRCSDLRTAKSHLLFLLQFKLVHLEKKKKMKVKRNEFTENNRVFVFFLFFSHLRGKKEEKQLMNMDNDSYRAIKLSQQ